MTLFGFRLESNSLKVSGLSCETDFVAKTEYFTDFLNALTAVPVENDVDYHKATIIEDGIFKGMTVEDGNKLLISKTQENCKIEGLNVIKLAKDEEAHVYVHNQVSYNMGSKIAVIVCF